MLILKLYKYCKIGEIDNLHDFNMNEVMPSSDADFDALNLFIASKTSSRSTFPNSKVGGNTWC